LGATFITFPSSALPFLRLHLMDVALFWQAEDGKVTNVAPKMKKNSRIFVLFK
jgi:hypothetical protein